MDQRLMDYVSVETEVHPRGRIDYGPSNPTAESRLTLQCLLSRLGRIKYNGDMHDPP